MRLHDLRHSAVAILIAQGVNIKAISELLGHSSVAFTLQVYGHLMEETKKETANKMDAALSPVASSVATASAPGKVNGQLSHLESGAPGGTRTPGLLVRSQLLYPAELRARRTHRIITTDVSATGPYIENQIKPRNPAGA